MTDELQKDRAESKKDFERNPRGFVSRWLSEIKIAEKENEKWFQDCKKIVKRYRDERGEYEASELASARKFNILWSNTQTLLPALYFRTPDPQVSRRYLDKDPIGRLAAQTLERAVSFGLDAHDFDGCMSSSVLDYVLTGRGQAWVMYEPKFGEPITDEAGQPQMGEGGQPVRQLVGEDTYPEFVHYRDFLHQATHNWKKVGWVARKLEMTREKLVARFGELGKKVPLKLESKNATEKDLDKGENLFRRALVWEIWDKETKTAIWICPDHADEPLDVRDDPLKLQNFFPCPRPMSGTMSTDSLIPVPDYVQYKDQAEELDLLTERIHYLTEALKVIGLYDGSIEGLQRMFTESRGNELIPVDNWAMFADKGGLKGTIDFFPVQDVVQVVTGLFQAREQAKNDLYEITGMADIIRGQSDPRETAAAQAVKSKFATLRLESRKQEVARFARDILAIMAEIIAEQFSPDTIRNMTGFDFMLDDSEVEEAENLQSEEAQQQGVQQKQRQSPEEKFNAAIQLLRDDKMRTFRLDIETDSTVAIDQQQEKQDRIEFLQALGGFLQSAMQAPPDLAPFLGQTLLFGVRGFKVGRELESALEDMVEQYKNRPQQPQENPEMQKLQMDMQLKQQEAQFKQQMAQAELQHKQQQAQVDAQLAQQKVQAELQAKREAMQLEHQLEAQKLQQQAQIRQMEIDANIQAKRELQEEDAEIESLKKQADAKLKSDELKMMERHHAEKMELEMAFKQNEQDMKERMEMREQDIKKQLEEREQDMKLPDNTHGAY